MLCNVSLVHVLSDSFCSSCSEEAYFRCLRYSLSRALNTDIHVCFVLFPKTLWIQSTSSLWMIICLLCDVCMAAAWRNINYLPPDNWSEVVVGHIFLSIRREGSLHSDLKRREKQSWCTWGSFSRSCGVFLVFCFTGCVDKALNGV